MRVVLLHSIVYVVIVLIATPKDIFSTPSTEYKPVWGVGDTWKILVVRKAPCPEIAIKNFKCNDSATITSNYLFMVADVECNGNDSIAVVRVYTTDSLFIKYNEKSYKKLEFDTKTGCVMSVSNVIDKEVKKVCRKRMCRDRICEHSFSFPLFLPDFSVDSIIVGDTLKPECGRTSLYAERHGEDTLIASIYYIGPLHKYSEDNMLGIVIRKCQQNWVKGQPWWSQLTVYDGDEWYLTGKLVEFNVKYNDK